MKKVSKFSFNVLHNIRNSDSFKELSGSTLKLADRLQFLQIEAVSLSHVLGLKNLYLSDMLGYAESSDFDNFFEHAEKAEEYFQAYLDSNMCDDIDVQNALDSILSEIAKRRESKEEE